MSDIYGFSNWLSSCTQQRNSIRRLLPTTLLSTKECMRRFLRILMKKHDAGERFWRKWKEAPQDRCLRFIACCWVHNYEWEYRYSVCSFVLKQLLSFRPPAFDYYETEAVYYVFLKDEVNITLNPLQQVFSNQMYHRRIRVDIHSSGDVARLHAEEPILLDSSLEYVVFPLNLVRMQYGPAYISMDVESFDQGERKFFLWNKINFRIRVCRKYREHFWYKIRIVGLRTGHPVSRHNLG